MVADSSSPTIQEVEKITGATKAGIFVSAAYQAGNLNKIDSACSMKTCGIQIPEATDGRFEGNVDQIKGYFYGTGHTEVGGFFNTETVTGAFGGTRQ